MGMGIELDITSPNFPQSTCSFPFKGANTTISKSVSTNYALAPDTISLNGHRYCSLRF